MKRHLMRVLAILLVIRIDLLPPPTAAQNDYVEVTFLCPPAMGILDFAWKNKMVGEYREAGKRHDYTMSITTSTVSPTLYKTGPTLGGRGIRCTYGPASGQTPHATYEYDVHRKIISCSGGEGGLTCKLKP